MKKFVYAIIIASVLGGACASAHADTFRYVAIEKDHFNSDEYSREEWEKDTITYEGKIGKRGVLCVGRDGKLCYHYSDSEERQAILNDLYEGEQQ